MPTFVNNILGVGSRASTSNLVLLLSLVGVIVTMPMMAKFPWLTDLLFSVVLLSCIRRVSTNRKRAAVAWSLGALPLLSLVLGDLMPAAVMPIARFLLVPFFVYTVVALTGELMMARDVTKGELFAAASTYMLIGLTWGVVYILVEFISPGSFNVPDFDQTSAESLIYFSYITLVTVGYGEITPITDVARSFAVAEALMGSLFLTMLVARLVGIYTGRQMEQPQDEADS